MTTLGELTPRQLQIAALYADTDLTSARIGARLGLAEATVRAHLSVVYRRLGVGSRQHLRSVLLECELAPVGGAR